MVRTKKFPKGTVPLNASIEPSDRKIVDAWAKWLGLGPGSGQSEAVRAIIRTAEYAVEECGIEVVVAPEDEDKVEGDSE